MKSPSGRKWLLASLLAFNAAAIALVIVGLDRLYERSNREAEIHSQNIALAVALHVSSEISKIDLSLRTVAAELEQHIRQGRPERDHVIQALIARQKAALPEAEAWGITDTEGRIVFHEGQGSSPSFTVADRDYFRDLQSGRNSGLAVSKPLKSRLTGNWNVTLTRAIRDSEGRFNGVVVVPLPVKSLHRMLNGFDLGNHGVINLRDIDLGLITRFPEPQTNHQDSIGDARVSQALRDLISAGQSQATYHALAPFDNRERVISLRTLNNAPIHVLASIAKKDYLEDWQDTAWQASGIVLLLLVACNTALVLLHRQWRLQQHTASALREGNARLETSLQHLRERDHALVAAQHAGLLGTYSLDIATGTWTCSGQLEAIFGIDANFPHTVEGWQRLMHPDDRGRMIRYFATDVVEKRGVFDQEYRIIRPSDGQVAWVHGLGQLDFDAADRPIRMSGTIQDVSARRAADDRLHLAQEVFLNTTEGFIITDCHGTILETNPAFTRITGYSAEEAKGRNPRILKSGAQDRALYETLWRVLLTTGRWDGELVNLRKGGTTFVQNTRIFSIYDEHGKIVRFAAVISDITRFKESQRRLEHLAYFDALTGLPNRARLAERMRQAMTECRGRSGRLLSICCLDLDGFKDLNDRLGHDIGDQFLVAVAQRLCRCAGASDTVARLGGDEFVVLFCELQNEHDAINAANRLLETSAEAYTQGKYRAEITLSIGVSLYPASDTDEPDVLLRQADQAMYDAKRHGKNCVRFFDVKSERERREHQAFHDRLVEALEAGEFRLHYQPKVSLRNGAVTGVEALLRWQHPERGLLPPLEFLSVIEASELTLPLGEWILHEALRQQRRWRTQGLSINMSVNIFGLHLQRADFVERLDAILRAHPDTDPRTLELEVVETTALENLGEVTERIRGCMELGVGFALDDFGTGYSSLTYLRQLPVGQVKIDRSFVRDMLDNPDDQSLVESIVGMAHTLGRQVVAEGVETVEHGALLIRCGCDSAQGFGIARPMEPEKLPDWVARWKRPEQWVEAITAEFPFCGKK